MNKFKKQKTYKQGFSLLEIIIVLGILSVGLLGISSLVTQSTQTKNINQNYLVASMLAQEGLELVRNIRDENWLVERNWEFGTSDVVGNKNYFDIVQDGAYRIDYGNGAGTVIDDLTTDVDSVDNPNAKLFLNVSGFYTHSGTIATPFSRIITVTDITLNDSISVKATVQWYDRGKKQIYEAETELYNWR